jgi:hypothetical protein
MGFLPSAMDAVDPFLGFTQGQSLPSLAQPMSWTGGAEISIMPGDFNPVSSVDPNAAFMGENGPRTGLVQTPAFGIEPAGESDEYWNALIDGERECYTMVGAGLITAQGSWARPVLWEQHHRSYSYNPNGAEMYSDLELSASYYRRARVGGKQPLDRRVTLKSTLASYSKY